MTEWLVGGPGLLVGVGALLFSFLNRRRVQQAEASRSQVFRLLQEHEELRWQEVHQRIRHLESRSISDVEESDRSDHEAALLAMRGRVRVLEMRMAEHDALLCSLISEDEARHLWNLNSARKLTYERHPEVDAELRSLVRRGLLVKTSDFRIHRLPLVFDPADYFAVTPAGKVLLILRKHMHRADVRQQDSLPPPAADLDVDALRGTALEHDTPDAGDVAPLVN